MTLGPAATASPGWYPDPSGAPFERWWDGMAWSQATRPAYAGPPAAFMVPVQAQLPRNGAATAGLVLGIICMFVNSFLLISTPAFICSIVGLVKASQLQTAGYAPIGRAAGVWGLVLSVLGTIGTVFFKLFLF